MVPQQFGPALRLALSTSSRRALPSTPICSRRALSVTSRLYRSADRPEGVHPDSHTPLAVSRGDHVAEHAKEQEQPLSGVPKNEEASAAPLARVPLPDLFSLKNRTFIVTGGARGMGLTVARAMLEGGAHVHCLDMLPNPDKEAWAEAVSLANSKQLTINYHQVDVTSQSSLSSVFSECFANQPSGSPIRGIYIAAGINQIKPALDYTPDEFRKVIDVNLTGTFFCAQAFAKEWFERNSPEQSQSTSTSTLTAAGQGASIVLTGSMSGHVANVGLLCAAYNASKAGVNQLAKSLAMEWSGKGIRVNSVSPGYVRTALTAALLDAQPELDEIWHRKKLLNRLATPDEMRGPIAYLLSDASSFMTGADLLVDGGHCAT